MDAATGPCGGAVQDIRVAVSKVLRGVAQATPCEQAAVDALAASSPRLVATIHDDARLSAPMALQSAALGSQIPLSHDNVFAARLACAVLDSDKLLLSDLMSQLRQVARQRRAWASAGGASSQLLLLPSIERGSRGLDLSVQPLALRTFPYSLLHLAAIARDPEVAEAVLSNTPSLELVGGQLSVGGASSRGLVTPLHLAASCGRIVCVTALLAAGASTLCERFHATTIDGRASTARVTPLHDAVTHAADRVGVTCQQLLELGKDATTGMDPASLEACQCCLLIARREHCDCSPKAFLSPAANQLLSAIVAARYANNAGVKTSKARRSGKANHTAEREDDRVSNDGDQTGGASHQNRAVGRRRADLEAKRFVARRRRLHEAAELSFGTALSDALRKTHALDHGAPDTSAAVQAAPPLSSWHPLGAWVDCKATCPDRVVAWLRSAYAAVSAISAAAVAHMAGVAPKTSNGAANADATPPLVNTSFGSPLMAPAGDASTNFGSPSVAIAVTGTTGRTRGAGFEDGTASRSEGGQRRLSPRTPSTANGGDRKGSPPPAKGDPRPSALTPSPGGAFSKRLAFAAASPTLPAVARHLERDPLRVEQHERMSRTLAIAREAKLTEARTKARTFFADGALNKGAAVVGPIIGAVFQRRFPSAVASGSPHPGRLALLYLVRVAPGEGTVSSATIDAAANLLTTPASLAGSIDGAGAGLNARRAEQQHLAMCESTAAAFVDAVLSTQGCAREMLDVALVPAHCTEAIASNVALSVHQVKQRRKRLAKMAAASHAVTPTPTLAKAAPRSPQPGRRSPSPDQTLEMERLLRDRRAKVDQAAHLMRLAAARAAGMSWS